MMSCTLNNLRTILKNIYILVIALNKMETKWVVAELERTSEKYKED